LCGIGNTGDIKKIHDPERVEFRVGISDAYNNEISQFTVDFYIL